MLKAANIVQTAIIASGARRASRSPMCLKWVWMSACLWKSGRLWGAWREWLGGTRTPGVPATEATVFPHTYRSYPAVRFYGLVSRSYYLLPGLAGRASDGRHWTRVRFDWTDKRWRGCPHPQAAMSAPELLGLPQTKIGSSTSFHYDLEDKTLYIWTKNCPDTSLPQGDGKRSVEVLQKFSWADLVKVGVKPANKQ